MSESPAVTTPPANPAPDPPAPPAPDPLAARKERREARQFWIDLGVKFGQALVVVVSGLWAVHQYLEQNRKEADAREEQQARELKVREKELAQARQQQCDEQAARRRAGYAKFHEEQRPVYLDLCRAAAQIASAKDFTDVPLAFKTFREIHCGQLLLVCDQPVLHAANVFKDVLDRELDERKGPSANLRNHSIFLAMACQRSLNLNRAFGVDLALDPFPPLENSPYTY